MILAEANQWPADVRALLRRRRRVPHGVPLPADAAHLHGAPAGGPAARSSRSWRRRRPFRTTCQWGLFLRNHDELTLEMVTDEERDYMYLAYSADPRMRINVGIRRRLAPLMDNNRRRIELLNSLLFSFPGTPIIYYGDEIGMGDNIYLGDRNGVRTPMQWSADRNAGFSRATPGRLYSPVIMDPVYGYEAINVEAQQSDASSLLHWMRNMIALRKLFKVFGRGTLEFLHPANRKVLAYVRALRGRAGAVRRQPVALRPAGRARPLRRSTACVPVEMLGYVEFPAIGATPYPLTLGPYGFLWFELQPAARARCDAPDRRDALAHRRRMGRACSRAPTRERLEAQVLPRFLPTQRWFGGKGRRIAEPRDRGLGGARRHSRGAAARRRPVRRRQRPSTCFLPLAIDFDAAATAAAGRRRSLARRGRRAAPACCTTRCRRCDLRGAARLRSTSSASCRAGTAIRAHRGAGFADAARTRDALPAGLGRRRRAEQHVAALRRPPHPQAVPPASGGANPDCEIGRFLTEQAQLHACRPFAGAIEYDARRRRAATLAMLQGLVPTRATAGPGRWRSCERYYEACAPAAVPADDRGAAIASLLALAARARLAAGTRPLGIYLDAAATLGRRTAELHLALGRDRRSRPSRRSRFGAEDLAALVADACATTATRASIA